MTAAVETHEGQDVATFDKLESYLHTETDKDVIMLLEVVLADIKFKVEPKIYRMYVITSRKGKPILYVQIKKGVIWPTMQRTTIL